MGLIEKMKSVYCIKNLLRQYKRKEIYWGQKARVNGFRRGIKILVTSMLWLRLEGGEIQ